MKMDGDDYGKYFRVLELPQDASLMEVRSAYLQLKELYSKDSIVTLPVRHEISEEYRKEILSQIEEAYHNLLGLFHNGKDETGGERPPPVLDKDLKNAISEVSNFNGSTLRQIRENLNIDLRDIAFATKISIRHLDDIEAEKYDTLPPAVYTRGFVVNYAKYLSLDWKKVADDYMKRYHEWEKEQGRDS